MAESLNGLYKAECYWRRDSWANAREVELATSSWVAWYNTSRPHSSIGDRTPIEYENAYYNGELLEPEDEPTDQAVRDPKGRYLPRQDRDNDRDINPRDLEHAG